MKKNLGQIEIHETITGVESIKILVTGDLFPGGAVQSYLLEQKSEKVFQEVIGVTEKHDFCIAGLECPLTNNGTPIIKTGPHLKAKPECAKAINSAGFHALSLANNHIMDYGVEGLFETFSACDKANLLTVGAGKNLYEANQPLIFELKGVKITIIAIAENEFSIAQRNYPGANPLNPFSNYSQITKAKSESDIVVVILHGGNEYYPLPSPRVKETCRFFAEVGADAIICSHIHVPGGYEVYKNKPIVYSTGNFLFAMDRKMAEEWYQGYLVSLEIQAKQIISVSLIPYEQCRNGHYIELKKEKEANEFLEKISKLNEIISDDSQLYLKWQDYLEQKKSEIVYGLYNFNWVERQVFKRGFWPFWHMKKCNTKALINLSRCESHHDVLIHALESLSSDAR